MIHAFQRTQVAEAVKYLEKLKRQDWKPYFLTLQHPKQLEYVSQDMASALYEELGITDAVAAVIPEYDRQDQRLKGDFNYARTHLHVVIYATEELQEKVEAFRAKKGKVFAKLKKVWCMTGLIQYLSKQDWVASLPCITLKVHSTSVKLEEKAKPQAAIRPIIPSDIEPKPLHAIPERRTFSEQPDTSWWGSIAKSWKSIWSGLAGEIRKQIKRLFNPLE